MASVRCGCAFLTLNRCCPTHGIRRYLQRWGLPVPASVEDQDIEYGIYAADDANAMVRLLGEVFSRWHQPAVAVGRTESEFEAFVWLFCPRAAVERLTVVARNGPFQRKRHEARAQRCLLQTDVFGSALRAHLVRLPAAEAGVGPQHPLPAWRRGEA